MLSTVLLNVNDVHLELQDDDHDVIHAVSSPLSFKVGMKGLMSNVQMVVDAAVEDVVKPRK